MKVRQRLAMVLALSTIFTTVPVTQVSATPREDIRVLTEKFNLVQVDKRDYTNPNIDVVATGFPDEIVIGESYNVSFEIRVDGEIPESYDVDASVIEYDENTDIYFENEHYDSDTGIYSFELYGESPGKAYVTLSYRYDVVYVVEMDVIGDVAERPYLESVYNEFTVVSGADLRLPIITNVPAEDIGVELSWQYSGEFEEDLTVEYRDGGYYLSSLAMPEGESYEQANLCLSFPDIYGDTLGAIIELEVLDKFEDDEQPIPLEIGYYIKDTYFVGDVVQLSFDWDKPNDDYWYQVPNENFVWWDFSEHDVMVEYPNAFTVTQPGTYRLTVTNFEQTHSDYKDITFLPRYDSGNSMLVTDISYASDNRSATVTILKPQDIEFFNLGNGLKVYSDNYSFTVYESGTYNIQYTDPITDSTVNVPIRINLDELSPTIYYIGTDEWNSVPEAIAIDSDRYLSHTMNGIEYRTNLAMVDEAYGTPIVFNNQDGGSCSFVMEIVESVEGFVEMNYNKNSTNKGMPIHVRDFSMGNIGVKDVEYMGEYFTYNNPVELKVTTASALSITTDSSISFEPAPLTSGYDNNGTVTYRGDGVYRICVQHSGGEYDYYVNVDARPDMSAIGTVLRNEDGTYSLDVKSPNADIIKVLFMDGTDYIPDRGMRRDFNLEFTGLESVEGSVNIVLVDENYNVMVVPYSQYYIPEPDEPEVEFPWYPILPPVVEEDDGKDEFPWYPILPPVNDDDDDDDDKTEVPLYPLLPPITEDDDDDVEIPLYPLLPPIVTEPEVTTPPAIGGGSSSGGGGGGGSSSSSSSKEVLKAISELQFTLPAGTVKLSDILGLDVDGSIDIKHGVQTVEFDYKGKTYKFVVEGVKNVGVTRDFKDVSKTHWAMNSIVYGVEQGLLYGVSDTMFLPEESLKYSDGLTVLNRVLMVNNCLSMTQTRDTVETLISGTDFEGTYAYYNVASIFSKLNSGSMNYYSSLQGVVTKDITRGELAGILYGVTKELQLPTSDYTVTYNDLPHPSEAVVYCGHTGLMIGDDKGNFNLDDGLSRAELSAVAHRLDIILKTNK